MKAILTTGQVAKLCSVAPRTVSKWFDSGSLKGYRIPGSQDRRIPRENLVKFLRENGMPLGELATNVLVVSQDAMLIEGVESHGGGDFDVVVAPGVFEAGAERDSATVVIVDFSIGEASGYSAAAGSLRKDSRVIAVVPADAHASLGGSLRKFVKPVDVEALVKCVKSLIG